MFNKLLIMIKNPSNNVHAFVKVALPAVESTDKDGKYKVIADPKLDAQSILNVLVKYWDNSYLCKEMLTRFIRVVCDTAIRNFLASYALAYPDATQEDIDAACQSYADAGWNVNLKHPSTPKKQESEAKKTEKATSYVSVMATEQKAEFFAKQLDADPALQAHIDRLVAEKAKANAKK